MKKQLLAAGLVAAMSMGTLAGCASNDATSGSTDAQGPSGSSEVKTDIKPLELVESGYSIGEQGYIHYGAVIKNPNADALSFPVIKITGRDDAGAVVFSEEQMLMNIAGSAEIAWAGQAGNGTAPTTVEFEVSSSTNSYGGEVEGANQDDFTVQSVSATDSGYGTYDFVGEVTNNTDKDASQAAIVVLLRNADGAIVSGYNGFSSNVAAGATTAFDVLGYEVPEYKTVEARAYTWL